MAEAANGKEAIRILEEINGIRLIVTDLNMPGMSGNELIIYLRANFPDLKIVILSMSDHEKLVSEAFKAGANGYLLKQADSDQLTRAIREAAAGPSARLDARPRGHRRRRLRRSGSGPRDRAHRPARPAARAGS